MLVRTIAVSVFLALAGCAQGGGAGGGAAINPNLHKVVGRNGVEGEINGTVVRGSKFSQVQIGMGATEVESIIGKPDDTDSHITGKQFIPFYFGGDGSREEAFYRGQGQLTYTHTSIGSTQLVLIGITVDPTERGFAH